VENLVKCPSCGNTVSVRAKVCPKCRAAVNGRAPNMQPCRSCGELLDVNINVGVRTSSYLVNGNTRYVQQNTYTPCPKCGDEEPLIRYVNKRDTSAVRILSIVFIIASVAIFLASISPSDDGDLAAIQGRIFGRIISVIIGSFGLFLFSATNRERSR